MRDTNDARVTDFTALTNACNHMIFVLKAIQEREPNDATEVGDTALLKCAEQMIRERQCRKKHLADFAFGEPVWDILLDLFVAHLGSRSISVSSACLAAKVPPTTALRYIAQLEHEGKLQRDAHPDDARVFYLSLSPDTLRAMRSHLSQIVRQRRQIIEIEAARFDSWRSFA